MMLCIPMFSVGGMMAASMDIVTFLAAVFFGTVVIPPAVAVIIADYYLYERKSGLYSYENAGNLKNFRSNTCLSVTVGIVVGLLCNYADIPFLNALCTVFPACVLAMLSGVAVLVIYNAVTPSRDVGLNAPG